MFHPDEGGQGGGQVEKSPEDTTLKRGTLVWSLSNLFLQFLPKLNE